jgi:hypothetical protein
MGTWINVDHTANFVENHGFHRNATANMPIVFQVISTSFTNTTRKIMLSDLKWQHTNITDEEGERVQKLEGVLAMNPEDQINFLQATTTISDPRIREEVQRMVDYESRNRKPVPSTCLPTDYWNSHALIFQQLNTLCHDGNYINIWANPFVYDVVTGRPTVPCTNINSAFSSIGVAKVEFLTSWSRLNASATLPTFDKHAVVLDSVEGTLSDVKTDPGNGATVSMQLAALMAQAAEMKLVQDKLLALTTTIPPTSADANSKLSLGGDATANLNQSENPNLVPAAENKSPPPPGLMDKSEERETINKTLFPKVSFQV